MALNFREFGKIEKIYVNGVILKNDLIRERIQPIDNICLLDNIIPLKDAEDRYEIIMYIPNKLVKIFGPWYNIVLDREENIRNSRESGVAMNLFLCGILFIMGIYHLGFFILRTKDRSPLYFAIICFMVAIYTLVTGERYIFKLFPTLTLKINFHLIFLPTYIAGIYIFKFVNAVYPGELKDRIVNIIQYVILLFMGLLIVTPIEKYLYHMIPYYFLLSIAFMYLICTITLSAIRKREGALIFLFGYIIFFISIINDILYARHLIESYFFISYGLIFLILSQAVLLSIRFTRAFSGVESLSTELEISNERLKVLDKLKDEFLANTSHELRTPLHGIIGLTRSLLDGVRGKLPSEANYDLSLVEMSSRRLANLVNDILDFSKLKNRDIELQRSAVDIKTLTDTVIDILKPLLNKKPVEIKNLIEVDTPLLYADENRLQQIMFNLIGNAIKFTEKGEISISAEYNSASVSKSETGMINIKISDTGIGIEEDKLDFIFESFEQANGSISREYGGSGIGLSIVKHLIELHGGNIFVKSDPGNGSTFNFSLPLGKKEKTTKQAIDEIPAIPEISNFPEREYNSGVIHSNDNSKPTGNILIVDDDPVNLRVIKTFFHNENYRIVEAQNGEETLELVNREKFDLILLDIMMPKISGYDVCRKIRESYSNFDLPVIMLTAKNNISDLVTGFESGANDYLVKPVNKEELLSRVKTLVTLKKTVKDHHEAKYKLLQDRMSPHFLFNSLNSIYVLMDMDTEEAGNAIMLLANIYRFLTDKSSELTVPFDYEWEFISNFLEIEKLQYMDTLSIHLEKNGDFSDIMIPPLTIQPLVENAFKHGLMDIERDGYISVHAFRNENNIDISVSDNGLGIEGEVDFSRSLGNIIQRLGYYFKNVDLKVENRQEGGTRVLVKFQLPDK